MKVQSRRIEFSTDGEGSIRNVTEEVSSEVKASNISNGIVTVFVPGSTGAVTTLEYEPGLAKDLPAALERIAPRGANYEHQKMWHDGNGHSHVRASIVGPSLTIPISGGQLSLGTWQQVVFLELDIKPRMRSLVLTILGE